MFYLARLEAILRAAQTYGHIGRAIVIDDGSTDNTGEILNQLAKAIPVCGLFIMKKISGLSKP